MSKGRLLTLLGALLAVTAFLGWRYGDRDSTKLIANSYSGSDNKSRPEFGNVSKPSKNDSFIPTRKVLSEIEPLPPLSVSELLSRAALEKNLRYLLDAQIRFPDDPSVILVSAMTATDINSPWLERLEKSEPQNRLPNIVRSGIFARQGDYIKMIDELKLALGKSQLDTQFQQRQGVLLDALIERGQIDPGDIYSYEDRAFFENLDAIFEGIADHNALTLIANNEERASFALALGLSFRGQLGLGATFDHISGNLESYAIQNVPGDWEYGKTGMTVSQRSKQLNQLVKDLNQKFSLQAEWINGPRSDPVLRSNFFVRLRSDGEISALNWLAGQIKNRN